MATTWPLCCRANQAKPQVSRVTASSLKPSKASSTNAPSSRQLGDCNENWQPYAGNHGPAKTRKTRSRKVAMPTAQHKWTTAAEPKKLRWSRPICNACVAFPSSIAHEGGQATRVLTCIISPPHPAEQTKVVSPTTCVPRP